MLGSLLHRSVNRAAPRPGSWTVIWQCRTRTVMGDRAISEEDYLRWLLGDTIYTDVADTDNDGRARFSHICDKAIIVYSRDKKNEKEFFSYLKKFKEKLCIIIHLSDEFCTNPIKPYRYASFVLRNYNRSGVPVHVRAFPLGCTLGKVPPGTFRPARPRERRYVWSFAGHAGPGKPDRQAALDAFASLEPNFQRVTDSFHDSIRAALKPREYCAVMSGSTFALCPRGNKSLDCFRNYEAAMYGAIPVVVGEPQELNSTFIDPFDAPFLYAQSWDEARREVETLLAKPSALEGKQRVLLDWWARWPGIIQGYLQQIETGTFGD